MGTGPPGDELALGDERSWGASQRIFLRLQESHAVLRTHPSQPHLSR
jgi:hypothetical protein